MSLGRAPQKRTTPRFAVRIGAATGLVTSILAMSIFSTTLAIAQSTTQVTAKSKDVLEVILLYDDDESNQGATSDDIIDAVKNPTKNARNAVLKAKLHSPKDARHMIRQRISYPTFLLRRSTERPNDDPPEVILQKYVVLTYPTAGAARAAHKKLQDSSLVIWAGINEPVTLSATVSDPYAQTSGSVYDYQWGLYAIDTFSAWDKVRGHAYVGHIDTGVETHAAAYSNGGVVDSNASYTLHPDLTFNFRSQFAYDAVQGTRFDDYIQGFRGHGTHTAGIIAANTSNPNTQYGHPSISSQGGAGICWYCSLMIAKAFDYDGATASSVSDSVTWAVNSGAQIINLSLGLESPAYGDPGYCATNYNDALCMALQFAAARDVMVSAAAGNGGNNYLQFPASDSRTIAVGASQINGTRWIETVPQGTFVGSNTGGQMASRGVIAPGMDVLSTVYEGFDYNLAGRCADSGPGTAGIGYGVCTGTSMAAPHVTGVLGLMRSINPLLRSSDISSYLFATSGNASAPDSTIGYGLINANAATTSVLATTNRLTPLFSLYSSGAYDYFYTTVPQMGSAASNGTLMPNNGGTLYSPVGTALNNYSWFPGTFASANAQAWVFTTHANPYNPSVELRPLYRLSYKCGDPLPFANPVCDQNWLHVDHFYSTDINEVITFVSGAGYKVDGIEGYVYPYGYPQPPGTEALIRGYHSGRDDHAIFPSSEYVNMDAQGYNVSVTYLGYVYRNDGNRPNY